MQSVADHDWTAPPDGIDDLVRNADLVVLPAAAAYHGVAGCLFHSLRDNPLVDADVAEALRATYHRATMTHLETLAELRPIAPALDSLGTPWLVVKGPVLAEIAYPRPDLRGYTDLDIVVPGRKLGQVLDALEQMGALVVDANWDLLGRTMSGEVHLTLGRGTCLDLHWHLLNIGELRQDFPLVMAELYERARRVQLPGCRVPTLDRVDTVVHLGLHGCLSGANRLVWLKDMEQSIAGDDFPWDELVARSRSCGAGLAVASMLLAARSVIGTRVPDDVTRDLAGSRAWPRLVSTTAHLCRIERTTGRRSPLRLIARSTRADMRTSTDALVRRGLAGLRDPLSRWPDVGTANRSDPGSVFHPAGCRTDFLAAVAGCSDR